MGSVDEGGTDDRRDVARYVRLLPVVLLVGGFLVDYLTPAEFSGTAFYSVAPMIAAPLMSLRGTCLIGIGAIAADAGILNHFGYINGAGGISELLSITAVAAVAVFINRVLHVREVRLRSARGIAAAVQRAVLPEPPERVGPFRIAARYEAAEQDADIGGDLYAVQETPFGLRCVIGDVRGKGMEAVEAATVVLGAFRMAADEEPTLAGLAARMDRALWRESERREGLDRLEGFTTAVLVEIALDGGELRLVNRGHPPPLVLREGGVHYAEPSQHALPLGMGLETGVAAVDALPFPPGASLLMHTDGVTEARNADGTFYDPVTRLAGVRFDGPAELLQALLDDVHLHTGGPRNDDMALLAVTHDPRP
ncbi:PP2C family protein-serine/threonine phosphatase [Streptomyces sp. NPDC002574]|uniref:PP2C family protein-serine/threonine phosphatase n=1 Tax=Streptomyces sp. NPDC002574 TaxID=3364652 RepID=UPI0036A4ED15